MCLLKLYIAILSKMLSYETITLGLSLINEDTFLLSLYPWRQPSIFIVPIIFSLIYPK